MFEKMKPLGDKALVKRIEQETKTKGGLFIPDSAAKEKGQDGIVIATGPGRTTPEGKVVPMTIKAGDRVFFGKYSGTEAGEDYLIIREDEILGVVEK
jgi:chaperonin GroES